MRTFALIALIALGCWIYAIFYAAFLALLWRIG